jgi:hypothetical protein
MPTFTDTTGRVWTIAITVDTVRRVRNTTNVDLLDVAGGTLIERLVSDPVLLCDVLFAVIRPEAEAKQISDGDFGRALAGDVIDAATTALLEGLVSFFPSPKRRVLTKVLEKLNAWQREALAAAELRLDSPELAAAVQAAFNAPPPGISSGDSPALPEPMPAA